MAPAGATSPDDAPGTSEFARSVLTADGSGIRFRPLADGRLEMSGFSINPHQRDWNDREVFRRPGTPQSGRQTTVRHLGAAVADVGAAGARRADRATTAAGSGR